MNKMLICGRLSKLLNVNFCVMAARNCGQQGESVNSNYMNIGYMKCSFPKGSDKWTYIYRISIAPLNV